jgi:hypothetical protein
MFARPPFQTRRLLKQIVSGLCIASGLAVWSSPALAYRPFDGTDAAVAAPGEIEIELQPAGRLRDETGTSLIAPATVHRTFPTLRRNHCLQARQTDPPAQQRRSAGDRRASHFHTPAASDPTFFDQDHSATPPADRQDPAVSIQILDSLMILRHLDFGVFARSGYPLHSPLQK